MEPITQYILKLIEILECEARLFTREMGNKFEGSVYLILGILLIFVAILVLAWTCFEIIATWLNSVILAGLVSCALLFIIGGVIVWKARKKMQ